jgi:hypothetical protein
MTDFLKQVEIARHIGNLISRVRTLERAQRLASRTADLEDGQQPTDANPQENRFIFYPTIVQSIINETTFLGARAIPGDDPPWIVDPVFAEKLLTVTAPEGITIPEEDSVVGSFFTGTYDVGDVPTPRYGLFGAGGAAMQRASVTSISLNTLQCDFLDELNTIVATAQTVAKVFEARMDDWDGVTKDGVTYTTSSPVTRTADDGTDIVNETLVPPYSTTAPGNEIYAFKPTGKTGINTVIVWQEAGLRVWRASAP